MSLLKRAEIFFRQQLGLHTLKVFLHENEQPTLQSKVAACPELFLNPKHLSQLPQCLFEINNEIARKQKPSQKTIDNTFNLDAISEKIQLDYPLCNVTTSIAWARNAAGKNRSKRRCIQLGSYRPHSNTILIHPILNNAIVPLYVIERVVHHELLHAALGCIISQNGRRIVHHPQFKQAESEFILAHAADLWIQENIDILFNLRQMRKRKKYQKGG
jgi:hypothetical protein